ncbi:MAG: toll/interleukin-1 receptor domain-containing protein [Anaerolineae bacterium]|nr:toll/interleukin-1 receptor domain-containing protein [Anaerolineae bacterium]
MQIFISYARADSAFAWRLVEDLSEYDLALWLDVRNIPKGANWDIEVQKGLDSSDLMLVLLSPDSVNSQNVADEWSYFIEKNKPVLPLLIAPTEVPFRLSRRQRIDFTNDYEVGFRELLRALGSPPRLDPDSTERLRSKPPRTERPERAESAPSRERPAFRSVAQTAELSVRTLPVVWAERYHWWRGMRGGTLGEILINPREVLLVPPKAPVTSIPLGNLISVKPQRALDPHLKMTFYGAQGQFQSLVLMGATRARRLAVNQEIVNLLKWLTKRSLE